MKKLLTASLLALACTPTFAAASIKVPAPRASEALPWQIINITDTPTINNPNDRAFDVLVNVQNFSGSGTISDTVTVICNDKPITVAAGSATLCVANPNSSVVIKDDKATFKNGAMGTYTILDQ